MCTGDKMNIKGDLLSASLYANSKSNGGGDMYYSPISCIINS